MPTADRAQIRFVFQSPYINLSAVSQKCFTEKRAFVVQNFGEQEAKPLLQPLVRRCGPTPLAPDHLC
jgi:hypothetical protein